MSSRGRGNEVQCSRNINDAEIGGESILESGGRIQAKKGQESTTTTVAAVTTELPPKSDKLNEGTTPTELENANLESIKPLESVG